MGIAGLLAFFFSAAAPTFSHDVAPILYARCVSCHRDTGVAPFPLVTYAAPPTRAPPSPLSPSAAAARRARLIATVTAKRYMPPWLPSAPRFQHEMRLSAPEIALLATWASSGAPEGNPRETPPPPKFPDGWPLGAPDLEAVMPPPLHIPPRRPHLPPRFLLPPPPPPPPPPASAIPAPATPASEPPASCRRADSAAGPPALSPSACPTTSRPSSTAPPISSSRSTTAPPASPKPTAPASPFISPPSPPPAASWTCRSAPTESIFRPAPPPSR